MSRSRSILGRLLQSWCNRSHARLLGSVFGCPDGLGALSRSVGVVGNLGLAGRGWAVATAIGLTGSLMRLARLSPETGYFMNAARSVSTAG